MFCGYVLSVEETLLQMEKRAATSPSAARSDKKGRTPIIEVKEPHSPRTRADQVRQGPELQDDKKLE